MPIKVLVNSINKDIFQKILDYYNSNKATNEQPLERLNRCEGGFQIRIPDMKKTTCNSNNEIKQLRWSRGYLVHHQIYEGFTEKEELLLYEALNFALGGNVLLE